MLLGAFLLLESPPATPLLLVFLPLPMYPSAVRLPRPLFGVPRISMSFSLIPSTEKL